MLDITILPEWLHPTSESKDRTALISLQLDRAGCPSGEMEFTSASFVIANRKEFWINLSSLRRPSCNLIFTGVVEMDGQINLTAIETKPSSPLVRQDHAAQDFSYQAGTFPRWWRLFSYVLTRKTRDRVFEPAYQELLEDYLTTRGKYRTKWAKRWLTFSYTFRTCLIVLDCLRAMLADKAIALLARVVPEPLKRWWLSR
jgi:hypothetical protein